MSEHHVANASANFLSKAEHYIYVVAGYILVVAAAGLLVSAVVELIPDVLSYNYVAAMVHLLDRVLLVLMLAEIIYTVQRIARTRALEATPFLVVGIIAAVRRVLVITAESVEDIHMQNPKFQAAMLELALLGVMILLLAVAMYLLRRSAPPTQ